MQLLGLLRKGGPQNVHPQVCEGLLHHQSLPLGRAGSRCHESSAQAHCITGPLPATDPCVPAVALTGNVRFCTNAPTDNFLLGAGGGEHGDRTQSGRSVNRQGPGPRATPG